MQFDSIILDIDGTIWNTTQVVAEAWNKAIKENYPQVKPVTADILQGKFGKTMSVIAENLFSPLDQTQRQNLINKCCEYEHIAIKENKKNITYPNVVSTIKELSKKYKLFIVSNCQSGYIELTMEKNNITQYITDYECYGNTGNNKSDNIKLVIKRNALNSPVYVGDTQGDCDACKEAKIPFIWASYGFGTAETFLKKIETFDQLLKI